MKKRFLVSWLIIGLVLVSCSKNTGPTTPDQNSSPEEIVIALADEVIDALRNQDMQAVSELAHLVKGVRFSPYAYVQDKDLFFTPDQLVGLFENSTKYLWGHQDGSGRPLEMTFEEYYNDFVYDRDYKNAEKKSLNERIGGGSSIDNSQEYYSGGMVVEYYFSGSNPDFLGMDWNSLRLVFQKEENRWYLVGIIHDEWTI